VQKTLKQKLLIEIMFKKAKIALDLSVIILFKKVFFLLKGAHKNVEAYIWRKDHEKKTLYLLMVRSYFIIFEKNVILMIL